MALIRAVLAVALAACGAAAPLAAQAVRTAAPDTGGVPAGFGSLRRDEVAVSVQVNGLTLRAIPLEESVIRLLAPDSYQALRAVRVAHAGEIARIASRTGLTGVQAWHVSVFNLQPGEARFDPHGMQVRSAGRDFRPLDVIGLVRGYDDGRLAQGRTVDAIFVFDGAVALAQPLTVTLGGETSGAWNDDLIARLDRERSATISRAAAARDAKRPAIASTVRP